MEGWRAEVGAWCVVRGAWCGVREGRRVGEMRGGWNCGEGQRGGGTGEPRHKHKSSDQTSPFHIS